MMTDEVLPNSRDDVLIDVDVQHENLTIGSCHSLLLPEFNSSSSSPFQRRVFRNDKTFILLKLLPKFTHDHSLHVKSIKLQPLTMNKPQVPIRFDFNSYLFIHSLKPLVKSVDEKNHSWMHFNLTNQSTPDDFRFLQLDTRYNIGPSFPCLLMGSLFDYLMVEVIVTLACLSCRIEFPTQRCLIEFVKPGQFNVEVELALNQPSVILRPEQATGTIQGSFNLAVSMMPAIDIEFPHVFFTIQRRHDPYLAQFFQLAFKTKNGPQTFVSWNPGTDPRRKKVFSLLLYVPSDRINQFLQHVEQNETFTTTLYIEGPWGLPLRQVNLTSLEIIFSL